jgi:hypothetical protein
VEKDYSLSILKANLYLTPLGIALVLLMPLPFLQIWGAARVFNLNWLVVHPLNLLLALAVLFASMLLHELLHAIGWTFFGRQPWSAIRFGMFWPALTPYTHLEVPIEINAYRIGGVLPGLFTGVLPYLIGLLLGNAAWLWLGILMTTGACGDLLSLWLLRRLPAGTMVQDHPSRLGCIVVE